MKKTIFTVLCFFLFIAICNAEVKTYDRNTLENYGVNKKWVINESNRYNVMNTHAVDASEKIYDFEDILSETDEYFLKQMIDEFYKTTGFDLIILTEGFYNLDDDDNGDYAQDFYDYNDFGIDDKYYSGVVIFRNNYPGYPWYNVYSFGEAQYYYYSENYSGRIEQTLDDVYNDMVAGNYRTAMSQIITDLTNYYRQGKEDGMENYTLDSNNMLVYTPNMLVYTPTYHPPILFVVIVSAIITFIYINSQVKKNKTVFLPRLAHDYLDNTGLAYFNKADIKYDSRLSSYTVSSSSGYSGGGGSRSFSSSRGSSGGGRSGGGGRRG